MPNNASISEYPPFPDDVPIIPLPRLSYAELLSNTESERRTLFESSTNHGFFLLDLNGTTEGEALLADVKVAFEIGRSFFSLDLEEKKEFKVNSNNVGYKDILGRLSLNL